MNNDELEEYLLKKKALKRKRKNKKILKIILHTILSIISIIITILLLISLIVVDNIITIISTVLLISGVIIPVIYFYYCQLYDHRQIQLFLQQENKKEMKHYDYDNRKLKLIHRKWKIVNIISFSCIIMGVLLYPITIVY